MDFKTWATSLLFLLGGKNVQAQNSALPTDSLSQKTPVETKVSALPSDTILNKSPSRGLNVQNETDSIIERPKFNITTNDHFCKVWLKTTEGKKAINAYCDALTTLMPKASLPTLDTEAVHGLMALSKIGNSGVEVGYFSQSNLAYDAEDLLGLKPDMADEITKAAKQSLKPASWRSGNCLQGWKNVVALNGLEPRDAELFGLSDAYQCVDYLDDATNLCKRVVQNSWHDTDKFPAGAGGVCERGSTRSGHIWWATKNDGVSNAVYINKYGERTEYEKSGESSDKQYEKSNTTGNRGRSGQKYGQPYVVLTNKTKMGVRTFSRELVNKDKQEQIENFRHLSIALPTAEPEFVAPTPQRLVQIYTEIKAQLLAEHNNIKEDGTLQYAKNEKFSWLKISPYKKKGGHRVRRGNFQQKRIYNAVVRAVKARLR